ncbi:MAG TPA: alcohol dehydrogenase catalytic domain-containing protein [Ktedonobacteraceae bacterium]|nr:alcohol dehydrogenase catalytic domain-containing protein [Ktedonobacteraceae bacterium]
MWTSTLDFDPKRVFLTKFLARFWRNACFSSFAPLSVQNLPRQSLPASNWVRVRNRLAGISGDDLHYVQGAGDLRVAPAALPTYKRSYPGREVVGEVIEIGEDVQHLNVGDRVVLQYMPNCVTSGVQKLCSACAAGFYNLCEKGLLPGPQSFGGGWSEEMLLHEDQLFRVAPMMSDEQAMMIEPTAVALHAVLRHLPRPGDQVLIVGAGSIGLLTLQVVRALVPDAKISILARHSFQVEQATRMGASHIIYPGDSYASIQRVTSAQRYQGVLGNRVLMGGYDVIYDAVGRAKTLHDALRWVRARGAVVLVGLTLSMMQIDLTPVWFQEIDLLGSLSHGIENWPPHSLEQRSTFDLVQRYMQQGKLHPEQLITHRFALNNYRDALLTAMNKAQSQSIKTVFDYSLVPASVVPNVRASARRVRPTAPIERPPELVQEPQPQAQVVSSNAETQKEQVPEIARPPHFLPEPIPGDISDFPEIDEELPEPDEGEATVKVNVDEIRALLNASSHAKPQQTKAPEPHKKPEQEEKPKPQEEAALQEEKPKLQEEAVLQEEKPVPEFQEEPVLEEPELREESVLEEEPKLQEEPVLQAESEQEEKPNLREESTHEEEAVLEEESKPQEQSESQEELVYEPEFQEEPVYEQGPEPQEEPMYEEEYVHEEEPEPQEEPVPEYSLDEHMDDGDTAAPEETEQEAVISKPAKVVHRPGSAKKSPARSRSRRKK